jgi:hypothetical protein
MREVCSMVAERASKGESTPGVCRVTRSLGGLEGRPVCLAPGRPLRSTQRGHEAGRMALRRWDTWALSP